MIFARHTGKPFTYYAGAGWSKADAPTSAEWNAYLKLELNMHQHPITAHWTAR